MSNRIKFAAVSLLALSLTFPARAQISGQTLVSGTTPVSGVCTNGQVLFNNAGVLGCQSGGGGGSGTVTSVGETFTGGLISVAGSPITTAGTFALTVAGTPGGIPYFASSSTWASSAALAANALVIGGGAGAAPATTTTGTGVLTALGIAVNTTGGIATYPASGAGVTLTVGSTTTSGGGAGQLMFDTGSVLSENSLFLVSTTALSTPSAPVITQGGTPGATAASYKVVAANNIGSTIASSAGSTTTSAATLTGTDYNIVTTPTITGSVTCYVFRTSSTQVPRKMGFIGAVTCGTALNDTGLAPDATNSIDGINAYSFANTTGEYVGNNLSVGSISGPTTSPVSPLIVKGRMTIGDYGSAFSSTLIANISQGVNGGTAPGLVLANDNNTGSIWLWDTTNTYNTPIVGICTSGGSYSSPGACQGGGSLSLSATGYETNGALFLESAHIEMGSSGGPWTNGTTDARGRIQFVTQVGDGLQSGAGVAITNSTAFGTRMSLTNGVSEFIYNTGYAFPATAEANGAYERNEAAWSANVFNFGPTAGGGGTLRDMQFNGAHIIATGIISGSGTGATLAITPTWNTSGLVDAALKINVTNTASATGSLLIDAQLGGVSQLNLDKSGNLTVATNLVLTNGAGGIADGAGNVTTSLFDIYYNHQGITQKRDGILGWNSGSIGVSSIDTAISREAAGVVQIGNSTTRNNSGTLDAAAYQVSGAAGVSCTLTVIAHLTVVNGIVTLCN